MMFSSLFWKTDRKLGQNCAPGTSTHDPICYPYIENLKKYISQMITVFSLLASV